MRLTTRSDLVILLLAAALLLASCSHMTLASQTGAEWRKDDLRALELPDAENPDLDIIAAYARLTPTDVEIRLDLLGSPDAFGYDLYLALDTGPGDETIRPLSFIPSKAWEILLHFPARGSPRAIGSDGRPADIRPRILRDGRQDSITVRVSRNAFTISPQMASFQAFVTLPGQTAIAGEIGPIRVNGPPPAQQAQAMLAFWDALPAAAPAQALRRWDGAHTGPYGQRHGLAVLLRAASASRVPVTILDLKDPARLSALDALGGLSLIREMQRKNLLLLPDLVYDSPLSDAGGLAENRLVSRRFGLAGSRYFYAPRAASFPDGYRAGFSRREGEPRICQSGGHFLIPLPEAADNENAQADTQALTVETRLALLLNALSPDPKDVVILGGSLPSSAWGDSLAASPAFEFLAGHPWINILDGTELIQFLETSSVPICPDELGISEVETDSKVQQAGSALAEAPKNLFSQLGWQTLRSLAGPTGDARLTALRMNYLGQIGNLTAASYWYENPQGSSACGSDLDWDGTSECILASDKLFLIFDPQGARLVLAAARTRKGPLLWVAPRSQFVVGLGDPSEWNIEAGLYADPQEIPGAFADHAGEEIDYQAILQPGRAEFTNPVNGSKKIFQLAERRLITYIESSQPTVTQLPLVLLDREAYSPGWYARYQTEDLSTPSSLRWKFRPNYALTLNSQGAELTMHSFVESLPFLTKPEDPDFGYPPGHYIPFPMAVVEVKSDGSYALIIEVQE